MKSSKYLILGLRIILAIAAPTSAASGQKPVTHGVDVSAMDRAANATADFYRYANGGWIDNAAIPNDKPAIDAFTEVSIRNEAILKRLVERLAASNDGNESEDAKKIGEFFRIGMDEARAEASGIKPLLPVLQQIDAITSGADIMRVLAVQHRYGIQAGFVATILPDFKDSQHKMLMIAQGGLSLPDRDYYLKDDSQSRALRNSFLEHVQRTFVIAGDAPETATAQAKAVLELETRLARASRSNVEMRDIGALYHKSNLGMWIDDNSALGGAAYFREAGVKRSTSINVATPEFFTALATTVRDTPLSDWKAYLRWQTISAYAPYLNKALIDEGFRFSSMLTGQKEPAPRWQSVLAAEAALLGGPLGKLYVAEAFSPKAKKRAYAMVLNLKASLRERIQNLDWMGPETKKEALAKLDTMKIKVGYPDRWKATDEITLGADSYAGNVLAATKSVYTSALKHLNRPVDRTEWGMTPQTVNAYYNPMNNEIVFPAGILQPPFFDPLADDASNYGGIGMVIGHEMTHGFDDQGRRFDAQGNLRDWWTAQDADRFKQRSEALVSQYSTYVATGETKVNGALTQGENISDLGGITVAYNAWKRTWKNGKMPAPQDGINADQRFFLAFAQIWRFKSSPAYAALLAQVDAHSPAKWRVLGTLTNVPEFREAFGIGTAAATPGLGNGTVRIW